MPDTRCWAVPTQRTWRGNPRAGGVPCLSARTGHGPRVVRRASSLIQWRPSHGGPLWRVQQWWQTKKHRQMRAPPCRSANSSRWSSRTNGSLGGSRLRLPPRVSRAWLSSLNEGPNGSRNAFRWKISSGSAIIYKRIRNYARPRSQERRCGKSDRGGRGNGRRAMARRVEGVHTGGSSPRGSPHTATPGATRGPRPHPTLRLLIPPVLSL
jgi:hypothetical protein